MRMLLLGTVGVLALQALLVWGYFAVSEQDPIVLNPDRGGMVEDGVMMTVICGQKGSGKEMLDTLPAKGRYDSWSRGRTIRGDCDIWYHQSPPYSPCCRQAKHTFDRRSYQPLFNP